MPLINHCNGGSSFAAVIQVTYNSGAVCTCTNGSTTLTAPDTSGSVNFKVKRAGAWTVSVSKDGQTSTVTVNVTEDGSVIKVSRTSYKVFGISRNITNSSPAWARTDDAVGFTATASVGTVAGSSSFDNCYPWSGIVRETLSTGDVMVKIPRFWYRRYQSGNVEYIKIATDAISNFTLHPAFNHANVPKDCIYVGAYVSSSSGKSLSGVAPHTNIGKPSAREKVQGRGSGWNLFDLSTLSAIQMLILVEFATNNVQTAIGRGNCDNSDRTYLNTGTCDNVPNLTGRPAGTNGETNVVWRGLEGLWGNVEVFLDGATYYGGWGASLTGRTNGWYICNDPSKYEETDDMLGSFTRLSFSPPSTSTGFITKMGYDSNNPHAILPTEISSGSESTYYCDYGGGGVSGGGKTVLRSGGATVDQSNAGIFYCDSAVARLNSSGNPEQTNTSWGYRIIFIPQEAAS